MVKRVFLILSLLLPAAVAGLAQWWPGAWKALVVLVPLILLGYYDILQTRRTLLRVYPVIGHGRYLLESLRPEIQQYFVESNVNGRPFPRELRTVVYQRAKGVTDTLPFGTQRNVDRIGYEWVPHSMNACASAHEERVPIGGEQCSQPYAAALMNVSAMSFGSLSHSAVRALNLGAKKGAFYHNTGEGGISPYHLQGGDLVWQIGTGYFGCRATDGGFDVARYRDNAQRPEVKMIELKLSQGAKPGHGGILPAAKLTAEIAAIRGVPMGHDVLSPPVHSTFSSPEGLLQFLSMLREECGGKPVGFKLCVGHRTEFLAICKAMLSSGIIPDFITVDGAEGGTGAAPLELSNRAGMPLREGLSFVHQALGGSGLRAQIKLIAAGKVVTAFDLFRTLGLGADLCNSARGMMMALGCIQAIRCNTNHCPVGVATQDPARAGALNVTDKAERVARYQSSTIHAFLELAAAAGLESSAAIGAQHVHHRVDETTVLSLEQLYPQLTPGILQTDAAAAPVPWPSWWNKADAASF